MRHKSGERITQCGFPGAVRSDHRDEFPFLHLQIYILQYRRIGERVFVGDVLQVYDSHSLRTIVMRTRAVRIQRINRSVLLSGIWCKKVLGCLDVKPRASMAMARSSTSTSEPNTSGPTSGISEPALLRKLLSVSSPRERCAAMMVCALACIWGRI